MQTAAELPTRLLVISPGRVDAYEGQLHFATWTAAGQPIDWEYMRELIPIVFDQEWAAPRANAGRYFLWDF